MMHIIKDAVTGEITIIPLTPEEIAADQPTPEQIFEQNKQIAISLLEKANITLLRCLEIGIKYPPEWKKYSKYLREVIAGTRTEIPTRPEYPAGT